MSNRHALARRAVLVLCAVVTGSLGPGAGLATAAPGADVTVSVCTEAGLRQAIVDVPDGGTVAVACDQPIVLTPGGGSTIVVDKTMTITGAGHAVTIDGGRQTSLFAVQAGPDVTSPEDLPTLTLQDLTLTGGWSQDAGYPGGGAVWNLANLVAERVRFVDNRAFNRGGAILSEGWGGLTVVDSTFTGNQVTCPLDGSGGGAIAVRQRQETTITGTTFTGNSAVGSASGGAVLAFVSAVNDGFPVEPPPAALPASPFGAPLVITDSDFVDNHVVVDGFVDLDWMFGGGAVAAFDHPLTVSATRFEQNGVTARTVGYGGSVLAASMRNAPTTITGVDVLDGGFPDRIDGTPTNGIGGGLALHGTPATVHDTVVDGNRAFVGGGLYTRGGPVEVDSSTLEGNVAGGVQPGSTVHGGGLATAGPLVLTDTAVVGNSGGSCLITWDGPAPTGDVIVDGGDNDVDDPGTCFRPAVPASPPTATGALTAPTTVAEPGSPVTVSGSGWAPGARITLVGYRLGPDVPAAAAGAVARTAAAAAVAAPVDLGAGPADEDGVFSATPVLPGAGVWRIVALGAAADGSQAALAAVVVAAAPGTDVAPVVTTAPAPVTAAAGSTVTLTAAAAGAPAPTARWQTSRDGGTTWADVPGATGTSLELVAPAGTTLVRAVFTNVAGSASTDPVAVAGTTTPGGGPEQGAPGSAGAGKAGAGPATPGAALARTGTEVLPLLGTAAAALLVGCAALLVARRTTPAQTRPRRMRRK